MSQIDALGLPILPNADRPDQVPAAGFRIRTRKPLNIGLGFGPVGDQWLADDVQNGHVRIMDRWFPVDDFDWDYSHRNLSGCGPSSVPPPAAPPVGPVVGQEEGRDEAATVAWKVGDRFTISAGSDVLYHVPRRVYEVAVIDVLPDDDRPSIGFDHRDGQWRIYPEEMLAADAAAPIGEPVPEPAAVDWVWPLQRAVDEVKSLSERLRHEKDVVRELHRVVAALERTIERLRCEGTGVAT